jgi:hypothetical protein
LRRLQNPVKSNQTENLSQKKKLLGRIFGATRSPALAVALLDILTASPCKLDAVRKGLAHSINRHIKATHRGRPVRHATIEIDCFPIEIHGKQNDATCCGYCTKPASLPLVAWFSVSIDCRIYAGYTMDSVTDCMMDRNMRLVARLNGN